jgi:hypothetical protein
MTLRVVMRRLAAVLVVAAGTAQPGLAQLQDVNARLHGGLIMPAAAYGDYFRFGPSVGVDLAYPLNERLDLKLDLDWDWVQTTATYPTPDTNLWRYRLGLDAFLVGERQSNALVQGYAGVGFTTSRSKEFWLRSQETYEYKGLTLNETALTATGGLRFGLRTPDGLTWWLTGKLNWSPVEDLHKDYLEELARNELERLGSALGLSVTLGVGLW